MFMLLKLQAALAPPCCGKLFDLFVLVFAHILVFVIEVYIFSNLQFQCSKGFCYNYLTICKANPKVHLTGLQALELKPLGMVWNLPVHLIFHPAESDNITLFAKLHLLPSAACIEFKSLMLAYKVLNGTAPFYCSLIIPVFSTNISTIESQPSLRIFSIFFQGVNIQAYFYCKFSIYDKFFCFIIT